ncbi:GGDEF domain-containing protein [Alicyclobacillus sp. ALC3]|uniref:GGDEF domain-containing protein n=1 Tax=Alicyclobacillus sp. ALC3 TaxID=2796143 RepID=UPI00237887B6|nr:GGDEF domain-containing protein [Alicyclobacillus sp. ALC3]WDL95799.1 GGDEF domain-containing protein [Alicyclobacillus sp. ALC3]
MNRVEQLILSSMAWIDAVNAVDLLHKAAPVLETLFRADGGFFLYVENDGDDLFVRVYDAYGVTRGQDEELEQRVRTGQWFQRLPHVLRLGVWSPATDFPESWQPYMAQIGVTCAGVWPIQAHERVAGAVILARKELPANIARENRIIRLGVQQLSIVLSLIVDREQAELSSLSDPLTGLPNRRGFMARWDEWREACMYSGQAICLGILDVDQFKHINDTQGHWIGDQMLQDIAAKLSTIVAGQGMCARWGGDEFIFVVSSGGAPEALEANLTAQLRETLPFVSFGTIMLESHSAGFDESRAIADERMYRSKAQRKRAGHKVRSGSRRASQLRKNTVVAGQKPVL